MSRGAAYQQLVPSQGIAGSREAPIAAWLHSGGMSRGHVSVTFPGTFKAISLLPGQITKLRKALEAAEAIIARDELPTDNSSIDLMKRISE